MGNQTTVSLVSRQQQKEASRLEVFHSGVFAKVQFGKDRAGLGYIVIARYSTSLPLTGCLLAVELKKAIFRDVAPALWCVYNLNTAGI